MIKKVTLILLLLYFVVSCGKKGDTEYRESQKKTVIEKVFKKIT